MQDADRPQSSLPSFYGLVDRWATVESTIILRAGHLAHETDVQDGDRQQHYERLARIRQRAQHCLFGLGRRVRRVVEDEVYLPQELSVARLEEEERNGNGERRSRHGTRRTVLGALSSAIASASSRQPQVRALGTASVAARAGCGAMPSAASLWRRPLWRGAPTGHLHAACAV